MQFVEVAETAVPQHKYISRKTPLGVKICLILNGLSTSWNKLPSLFSGQPQKCFKEFTNYGPEVEREVQRV